MYIFRLEHAILDPKLRRFVLRLKRISTGYSGLLTAYLTEFPDFVLEGDNISLYMGNTLVFTGIVIFTDDLILKASAEFSIGSGIINNSNMVFYNNYKMRLAVDFNIIPGVDLETGTHSIEVNEVTHYSSDSFYTEITI